jgi:type VI secretion system secreted protein VgrG
MPSPQSGSAGQAVTPAAPVAPFDADNADPGEMTAVKAQQQQAQTGKYGTPPVQPYKLPKTPEDKKKKSWIEIMLIDEDNKPVTGERYQITLPDGKTVAEGTTNEKGLARVNWIDPGMCKITFPDRDKEAWKRA